MYRVQEHISLESVHRISARAKCVAVQSWCVVYVKPVAFLLYRLFPWPSTRTSLELASIMLSCNKYNSIQFDSNAVFKLTIISSVKVTAIHTVKQHQTNFLVYVIKAERVGMD